MTSSDETLMSQHVDPDSGFKALFEDNGRVAYAYLFDGDRIIADVWLYNRGPAPSEPEWRDRSRAPFANPAKYVSAGQPRYVNEPADVQFVWQRSGDRQETRAFIFLHGELVAELRPGSKPGWSRYAAKDGPLARVLPKEAEARETPTPPST